jgi:endonuclease YncB( thermonuclease family)
MSKGRSARDRLIAWRAPLLLAVLLAAWWFVYRPIAEDRGWVRVDHSFALCGQPWNGAAGCVVDGDTIVIGSPADRRRIRLTGFDAPERDGACDTERALAETSRQMLHAWLAKGPFEWDGDSDPPYDQYGRELRAARRVADDGSREYLADIMIASGLAGGSGWGSTPINWCA